MFHDNDKLLTIDPLLMSHLYIELELVEDHYLNKDLLQYILNLLVFHYLYRTPFLKYFLVSVHSDDNLLILLDSRCFLILFLHNLHFQSLN